MVNYTYDQRGNLTEERQDGSLIRQYVYDTANRMVTGKDILSGAQTDYTYNALNMRIANTLTLPGTEAPQIRTTAYVPEFSRSCKVSSVSNCSISGTACHMRNSVL